MSRLHDQINHLQSYAVHLIGAGISENRTALNVVPFETATEKGFVLQPTRASLAKASPSLRSYLGIATPVTRKIADAAAWVRPSLKNAFDAVTPELPFFLRISYLKTEGRLSFKSDGIALENFGTHPDQEGGEEAIFNWICRASWKKTTERLLESYAQGPVKQSRDVSPA